MSLFIHIILDHTAQAYLCGGILELITVQLLTPEIRLRRIQHTRILFLWPYTLGITIVAFCKHHTDLPKFSAFIAEHV